MGHRARRMGQPAGGRVGGLRERGCRTDKYCRALRADFSVVEGLYIAGTENGSLYSRPYYEVGGSCSGLALSSGRLAGQQMAAKVLG